MTVSSEGLGTGGTTGPPESEGVAQSAQQGASNVSSTAMEQAGQVLGTAKEEAAAVGSEVRHQTRKLASDAQSQLMEHASAQRDSLAENLRSIGQELSKMADNADGDGMGVQLVRQGGDLSTRSAQFLQEREPGQLLDELRDLARRRPGAFLLGAVTAGFLVGRAAKGVKNVHSSDDSATREYPGQYTTTGSGSPVATATTDYEEPPPWTETTAPVDTPLTGDPVGTSSDSWDSSTAEYPRTSGDTGTVYPRGSEVP